jgi:hypothetical protein
MTAAQWSNYFLEITSSVSLTGTVSLVAPLNQGQTYLVQNSTTGGHDVVIGGSSGSVVHISSGNTVLVACDGTNYYEPSTFATTVTMGGDVTGASGTSTVVALQGQPVHAQTLTSAQDGYVLTWDNTDGYWHAYPEVASSITLLGDVTGPASANVVSAIHGTTVPASPSANQVLVATSSTSATWEQIGNAEVANAANIAVTKLQAGTSAQVLLNNATPAPAWTTLSGDVLVSNTGVTTVEAIYSNPVSSSAATSSQVLIQNNTATGSAWTSPSGDVVPNLSTPGQWNIGSITGNSGVVKVGATIEGNLSPVSYAIGNINMTGDSNITLNSTQYSNPILVMTSVNLTATRSVILPIVNGAQYEVHNNTTGNQSLLFIGSSGTGVTVPNNLKTTIYCNGTNYVPAATVIGGDLSANSNTAQIVVALQGNPVEAGTLTSVDDGYILTWTNAATQWQPKPAPISFTAGGDLGGTNTHQTVLAVNGTTVPASPSANQVLVATGGTSATWELISNAEVSTTAAVAVSKLAAGTAAQVLLNNATPTATWTSISGDVSLTSAGVATVDAIQGISVITGTPANNNVLGYNTSAAQLQYFPLGAGGGGGSTTASFIQPAVGSTVNVFVNSTQGFSNEAAMYLVDPNGIGGFYSITTIPSPLEFTLTNIGGFGTSSAASGVAQGALFIVAGKDVFADNLEAFGDGYDGVYASGASGTTTLLRDTFYSSMSWQSGSTSQINLNGFRLFCQNRCNLQNAPASAIYFNGVAGGAGNAVTTGGTAGIAGALGTTGTGNNGAAGGSSTTTTGGNGSVGILSQWSNGGLAGIGGAGGAGTGGSGGTSVAVPTTQSQILFHRLPDVYCAGNVLVSGGGGGSGGGAGGGLATLTGGGGGGGGSGGGFAALNLNEVYIDNTTAAGAISALGGAGGNGGTSTAGVGGGGGGAGGGGGGGVIVLTYGVLSGNGSGSTNVLLASGASGGVGGNGDSTGSAGGAGGHGGNGGLIELVNGGAQMVTDTFGAVGSAGGAASGTTGGSAGAGGLCGVALAPPNPLITAVYRNWGTAAGGWTFYIAGANLSTVSTVKIGTNICTSVTYHSSGALTGLISAVTPAYSSSNGSTTGQVITVTLSGGGIATSATSQQNYFYIPSNNTIADAHNGSSTPDITIGTGVSNLASVKPSSGNAWVQATGGNQPSTITNFNSTGLAGIFFSGSPKIMTSSYATTPGQPWTFILVSQITTANNTNGMYGLPGTIAGIYATTTQFISLTDTTFSPIDSSVPSDLNAHFFCQIPGASGTAQFWVDGTNTTGSQATTTNPTTNLTLGEDAIVGYASMNYVADLTYAGTLSSADIATCRSIFKQIYLLP